MITECLDCNKSLEDCTCIEDTIELPNQALIEAAERYIAGDNYNRYYDDFIEGAKWMQERSYSEEEVIELLQKALTHKDDGEIGSLVTAQGEIRPANFYSWFNKFKKK
jgi:hypothetical protein